MNQFAFLEPLAAALGLSVPSVSALSLYTQRKRQHQAPSAARVIVAIVGFFDKHATTLAAVARCMFQSGRSCPWRSSSKHAARRCCERVSTCTRHYSQRKSTR